MQTTTIPLWTISQDEYKAIKEGVLLEVNGQKTFVQVENHKEPITYPISGLTGLTPAKRLNPRNYATPVKFACSVCGEKQKDLRMKGIHERFKHGIPGQNAGRNAKNKSKATKKSRKK